MHKVDELRSWTDLGRVLYVGAHCRNGRTPTLVDILKPQADVLYCLEAFYPNAARATASGHFTTVLLGDIAVYPRPSLECFDTLVWWHGPEHVDLDVGKRLLKEFPCSRVWIGCPLGPREQGAEYENEYEIHRSVWYPQDFTELGYQFTTYSHRQLAYIAAWRTRA